MKFEITHTFDADVETVLDAMYDDNLAEYLQTNMSTIVEIETLSKEVNGSRVERKARYLPEPLIKKIGPKEIPPRWMEWIEESSLDRNARTMKFTNVPTTRKIANLLINRGQATFSSSGSRTRRVIKGELKVKVFLLGKIAEKFIYKQAARILDEEAATVNRFIAQRNAG